MKVKEPVRPRTSHSVKKIYKLLALKIWLTTNTGEKYLPLIRHEMWPSAWKNPFARIRNSSDLKLEGSLKSSLHCFNKSRAEEIDKVLKSETSQLKK